MYLYSKKHDRWLRTTWEKAQPDGLMLNKQDKKLSLDRWKRGGKVDTRRYAKNGCLSQEHWKEKSFLGMVKYPRKLHLSVLPQSRTCKRYRTKMSEEQGVEVMAKCLRHITDTNKSLASMHSHRKGGPAWVTRIEALCIYYGKRNHKTGSGWQ